MKKRINVNELRMILSKYFYGESGTTSDVYVEAVITSDGKIGVGAECICTLILDVRGDD